MYVHVIVCIFWATCNQITYTAAGCARFTCLRTLVGKHIILFKVLGNQKVT